MTGGLAHSHRAALHALAKAAHAGGGDVLARCHNSSVTLVPLAQQCACFTAAHSTVVAAAEPQQAFSLLHTVQQQWWPHQRQQQVHLQHAKAAVVAAAATAAGSTPKQQQQHQQKHQPLHAQPSHPTAMQHTQKEHSRCVTWPSQHSLLPQSLHQAWGSGNSSSHSRYASSSHSRYASSSSRRSWGVSAHTRQWCTFSSSSSSTRGMASSARAAHASTQPYNRILQELERMREGDVAQGNLTPTAVVDKLDRVIIGQQDAKRAVAIAFRNRWRRQRVSDPDMRREITPKNLLLIGPTGCGKTEIARRLAKLAEAPFIKVEATKFTEVGYHGRDVDSIVRDLVEASLALVKKRCKKAAAGLISKAVEDTIVAALMGPTTTAAEEAELRVKYRAGQLDDQQVTVDVPQRRAGGQEGPPGFVLQGGQMSVSFSLAGIMGQAAPGMSSGGGSERRTMSVAAARKLLEDVEAEAVLPQELLIKEAVRVAEQEGIVFIDEIDKIVNPSGAIRHGSDPSAEGVQRDLLPLIEGSVITTKHGPVATDHILFIASGAFTSAKPSDMMAELQGRLPIRVELRGLTAADFERILTEPVCNMIYQQQRLLGCEGVKLEFTPEAIQEIAAMAEQINKENENIGARRLHTVLERLVEDVSYDAPDMVAGAQAAAREQTGAQAEAAVVAPSTGNSGSSGSSSSSSGSSAGGIDSGQIARTDAEARAAAASNTAVESSRRLHGQSADALLQAAVDSCGALDDESYGVTHVITKEQVREKLQGLLKQDDLGKYIL